MSFGIIRVRKLTSMAAVSNTDTHNFRLYEERGIEPPENIKAEKWAKNSVSRLNSQITQSDTTIQKIIDERGIKTRKNNVLALEYVVALSPDCKDFYKMGYDPDAMLSKLTSFVVAKHGWENVISVSNHYDESNPHAHIVVIPAVQKDVKYKNRYGEGTKNVNTLAADDFVGGREKLRQLQSDFFQHVKQFEPLINSYLPKEDAITFYRGVDSRDTPKRKNYSMRTNASMGDLREQLNTAEKEERRNRIKTHEKKSEQGKEMFEKMNPFQEKPKQTKDFNMGI